MVRRRLFFIIGLFLLLGVLFLIAKFTLLKTQEIVVYSPSPNQVVDGYIKIEGKARGYWFFEGDFPVEVINERGDVLATHYVQAVGDWMTKDFVPFKGEIKFIVREEGKGYLILRRNNPSGEPSFDKEFRVPIYLKRTETVKVKVFFCNSKLNPEALDCSLVFPVEREIVKGSREELISNTILELLKGPTEEEREDGYFSEINPGVRLKSISVENGIALIDFDEQFLYGFGGSCRVSAIKAQIERTLKQFDGIREVVVTVNNREDVLQP